MLKKFSKKSKFAIAAAGLYLVLPTDVIPDFIIGFGQVDDLAVAGYVFKTIYEDLKKSKKAINQ
ncbi:YkvA family protein [Bacillus sp. E214]|uniref:YkvA family protein n=1 Tax=Bacillus sp. E214 TaxID=2587156 RepID=UPI0011DFA93B|nr:DUF1232 domain-containing protein [Bacillus sp. E214]